MLCVWVFWWGCKLDAGYDLPTVGGQGDDSVKMAYIVMSFVSMTCIASNNGTEVGSHEHRFFVGMALISM
jgi:hypothetical protein